MLRYVARSAFLMLALLSLCLSVARAGDAEEQRKAVTTFLSAYVRMDVPAIRTVVPANIEPMFGPYPFNGAYTLATPKVDENQALVDFTGPIVDGNIPSRGSVLLYKKDNRWYVRQILYYNKVPRLLNLPSRSITNNDRQQEPVVKTIAQYFMEAWKKGDGKRMTDLSYHWTLVDRDAIEGLSISNLQLTTVNSAWGEPLVKYTAKITYRWGLLSYSMNFKGALVLVKEKDAWKIRCNRLIFDF